jgi:hypothetical protein
MPVCCDAPSHPWDRWQVEQRWMPKALRCLIVGENPGDVSSEYFYEPPAAADDLAACMASCTLPRVGETRG